MSSTTATYITRAPVFNTMDPFSRTRRVDEARRAGNTLRKAPVFPDGVSTRESRSLDLEMNRRLPIGPRSMGSGSHNNSSTVSSRASREPSDKRKAQAVRRQGSLFSVPVALNPAANISTSSLSSVYSQASVSSAVSLPEVKGFSAARRRNANVPAPLSLNPRPGPSSVSSQIPKEPSSSHPAHRRSQTISVTLASNPNSGVGTPTPLTPSFRFRAAAIPSQRRKKLAKLARTLGENVPADLVFPSYPYHDSSAPTTPVSAKEDTLRDVSYADMPMPSLNMNTNTRRNSVAKRPERESGYRRMSLSAGTLHVLDANMLPRLSIHKRNSKGVSNWKPPAEWELGPSDTYTPVRDDRDEDELLGLWNADNYDTVMHRLRHLKR